MIRDLLPECSVVEGPLSVDVSANWPEEEPAVANASAKRRQEFAVGRAYARLALQRLGVAEQAVPRGSQHEPIWPERIVGSITHCRDYCAAAVAFTDVVTSVGIDAEVKRDVREGLAARIGAGEERLDGLDASTFAVLLFSAKESVYKAWYPLARRRLGFRDVRIVFTSDATFRATLVATDRPGGGAVVDAMQGRLAIDAARVFTTVIVRRSHP